MHCVLCIIIEKDAKHSPVATLVPLQYNLSICMQGCHRNYTLKYQVPWGARDQISKSQYIISFHCLVIGIMEHDNHIILSAGNRWHLPSFSFVVVMMKSGVLDSDRFSICTTFN